MQFINELSTLTRNIRLTCKHLRIQDFYFGNGYYHRCVSLLSNILTTYSESLTPDELNSISSMLTPILDAQAAEDYILLADLLEDGLLPIIRQIINNLIISNNVLPGEEIFYSNIKALKKKAQITNNNYYFELSKLIENNLEHALNSGFEVEITSEALPTLKYTGEGRCFYFHSNNQPVEEGNALAEYYISNRYYNLTVLGLGLVYHIKAMLAYDDRVTVKVIEPNLDVLTLAFRFSSFTGVILNEGFSIEYLPLKALGNELSKYLNNTSDSLFVIHYPTLKAMDDCELKNVLKNYFIKMSSMLSQNRLLTSNFEINNKNNSKNAFSLIQEFNNKKTIYIGGGPSLEYYMDFLKSNSDYIVFCASTVFKALLDNGIHVDYVMIIDAKKSMINHFKQVMESNEYNYSAGLIYLSTASHDAVSIFNGEKYILYQNEYASKHPELTKGYPTIDSGGSVSTTAIDFLLKCNVSELITIGLDLAHTDNKSHSFSKQNTKNNSLIAVTSVDNKTVYTTNVLNIYRLWIENRIKDTKTTKLVNLSHGALINGMDNRLYI